MNAWRVLLAILFPPLAVLDKGCGTATLVFVLTMFGWFPGVIVALLILSGEVKLSQRGERRFVEIPGGRVTVVNEPRLVEVPVQSTEEKAKRKGAFIRLEDGEVAEVVEDDGLPEKRKRTL